MGTTVTPRQEHVLFMLNYVNPATAGQLAGFHPLGMMIGTVRHHLAALEQAGLVCKVRSTWPRQFDLTDAGRAYLAGQGLAARPQHRGEGRAPADPLSPAGDPPGHAARPDRTTRTGIRP